MLLPRVRSIGPKQLLLALCCTPVPVSLFEVGTAMAMYIVLVACTLNAPELARYPPIRIANTITAPILILVWGLAPTVTACDGAHTTPAMRGARSVSHAM